MFSSSRALRILGAVCIAHLAHPGSSSAQIAVLGNTVEEHTAAAGESYTGRIAILNPGKSPEVVRLYQNDYLFSADGTSSFDPPGKLDRSNAAWISVQTTQVTIPAGGTVNVPYTVVVPKSDSLRGTYWSAIMVEAATRPPVSTETSGKVAIGVGTVVRYAIQVATHIGTSGSRSVKFDGTSAVQGDGKSAVELDVVDVGERGYRPVLWMEVYDAQGVLRGKAKQSRGLLYPGTSLHQKFDLGALASGQYRVVIFADTGEDTVFAAQYTLVF